MLWPVFEDYRCPWLREYQGVHKIMNNFTPTSDFIRLEDYKYYKILILTIPKPFVLLLKHMLQSSNLQLYMRSNFFILLL